MNKLLLFKKIIREANYENTYKMAFAKALVEIALDNNFESEIVEIKLERIAKLFLKYYWNQTIYFNLIQGSNPNKPPTILSLTRDLIDKYKEALGVKKPVLFELAEEQIYESIPIEYKKTIDKIISVLKKDVSYRFIYIDSEYQNEIYQYEKGQNQIYCYKNFLIDLFENHRDLFDLINYRWGLILENFNSCPRINRKVKIMDERKINRNSLEKFKKYLDLENSKHICFICGKEIGESELTVDHVIPWSYLYSDDLWNLVYACKSCNSSKNDKLVTKELVNKLNIRNNKLLKELENLGIKDKIFNELSYAIDKEYVYKFWISSLG